MSKSNADGTFFIGWLPMPEPYRRFLIPVTAALVLAGGCTAALVALLQRDPGPGGWEADEPRTFEGVVVARPYAMLHVAAEPRTFLLVEEGKFGALARVEELLRDRSEGRSVTARGTVLHRDGRWMLELLAGEEGLRPVEKPLGGTAVPTEEVLDDRASLIGEIVDPKCYLGAMKPGGGKTHKACAALCLRGGVPPMLVSRDAEGRETFYLLTTADGGAAGEVVVPYVGNRVEATGRLGRRGDLLVLRLAANGVRRQ